MPLKLFLLRHGETTFSQNGGYCGILDVPLTAAGQSMAQAFADSYASLPWQAIYSSPLLRARSTAQPMVEATGLELKIRAGLREANFGDWEGKPKDEVNEKLGDEYRDWMMEPAWNPPTNGETAVQIASRAMAVIAEIEETHRDGNVLIFSHKTTLRIILCSLLGIDLGRYRDRLDYPAASLSIVSFGKYGPLLERMGDRAYMPQALQERAGT
ncbi:MAG: histidine phosphatase family protein [Synechococcales cyanobacterium RM1_1_8]|nr:histidine phosphatase family protein [Synechococcales cyanobacterium RM1_1_8]